MTLSSSSRQHRKSMLPTPRLSSRISSRRAASGDASRIAARRVPSPLLAATSCNNKGGSIAQARAPHATAAATNCNRPLPEFCSRRAGSPSTRIPGPPSRLTPEQNEPTPPPPLLVVCAPHPEPKRERVDMQYPTPPVSAEINLKDDDERLKGQEGRTTIMSPETRDRDCNPSLVPAARHHHMAASRRPASTTIAALTAGLSSRVENSSSSPRDGTAGAGLADVLARKKSAFRTSSVNVSGKENRRPQTRTTRVPAPPVVPIPVPMSTVPQRSIRRTVTVVAAQQQPQQPPPSRASFRETKTLPRPLVIMKRPSSSSQSRAGAGAACSPLSHHDQVRSADGSDDATGVPAGVKALVGDVDRFAKEWTEMFDDLSAGADVREDALPKSKLGTSTCIRPTTVQPEGAGPSQADNPAAGKRIRKPLPPTSANPLQASTLAGTNGDAPADAEEKQERNLPEVPSTSASDPPTEGARYHPPKAILRNGSLPKTAQTSHYYLALPEINQSPIISGPHLVEMTTSVAFSNRKDELTESAPTTPARRKGTAHYAKHYPLTALPGVPSSPLSTIASLSSVSVSHSSSSSPSPWVNLRVHEFAPQRTIHHVASEMAVPTRSSSLRGLRAIFKRTSAGLTGGGGQRQRSESLKERISEPRVLSLGSVSITNLPDAGVASECALLPVGPVPVPVPEESTVTMGDLARKMTVRW